MQNRSLVTRVAIAIAALGQLGLSAGAAVAQSQRPPDDLVPALEAFREEPKAKSDAHRLVGKVVSVDRERGVVKLQTDTEGVRDVKPHEMLLRAVRVGDTISVARPDDEAVSASPRSPRR
jgi:hypothetical protein